MTIQSASLLLMLLTFVGGGATDVVDDAIHDVAPGDWVLLTGQDAPLAKDHGLRAWLEAAPTLSVADSQSGADSHRGAKTPSSWRRLRTRAGDESGLEARVPRVPAGLYRVWARRTGSDEAAQRIQTLRVQLPELLDVSTDTVGARTRVTVVGRHFGPRKGRVHVASRRARVVSWDVAADGAGGGSGGGSGDGSGLDRVVFTLPRRLGDGLHPVMLTTAAGSGRMDEALLVTGSARGPEPVLGGRFTPEPLADGSPDGTLDTASSLDLCLDLFMESAAKSVGYSQGEDGLLHLRGRMGSGANSLTLNIALRYDPGVQGAADLRGKNALVLLTRADPSGHQLWASAYTSGGSIQVHVLENDDGVLHGTINGLLVAVYGLDVPLRVSARFVAPPR